MVHSGVFPFICIFDGLFFVNYLCFIFLYLLEISPILFLY